VLLAAASWGHAADPVSPATRALLLDADRAGERIVGVGDHGVIVTSDDFGASWKRAAVPVDGPLTAVSFFDDQEGWAAGHGAVLLRTTDGGENWEQVPAPVGEAESFLDLLALAPGHLLAIGAYGLYFETRDAGASWEQRRAIEDDWHLNRITRGGAERLYLAGESGTLAWSTDQGGQWEPIEAPYSGSFYGLMELRSGRLLAYGLRGHVYTAPDPSGPWQQATLEPEVLIMTAAELPSGELVLAGMGGHVYVSADDGLSFTHLPSTGLGSTAELLVLDSGRTLAFGEAGVRWLDLPEDPN
jgi:photosystem II stability/assembly factor-like uncharacterized protein